MSKTMQSIKHHLAALREMYIIPTEAAHETRAEIRRIVNTFSFESHVADLRYEDLESANNIGTIN